MAKRGRKAGQQTLNLTPELMLEKFWEYVDVCENKTAVKTAFSPKTGQFVSSIVPAPVTATRKGFAIYLGMTEQNMHATYRSKAEFDAVFDLMDDVFETNAREKFETGTIPTQLAGLWMSNYGYTTAAKVDAKVDARTEIVIDLVDDEDG